MKRAASLLGLGPLGILLGATMLFGTVHNMAALQFQASQAGGLGVGAQQIVQAALNIAIHMSMTTANPSIPGSVFTLYNTQDNIQSPYPPFDQQKLVQYWSQHGESNLYNIQCAAFVSASLYMGSHPMVQTLGLAHDYWYNPGNSFPVADWQYILPQSGGAAPAQGIQTTKGMPVPGDVAVFNDGSGQGHVAIVIAVNPSTSGGEGTIVLAQANFPPNYYTLDPAKTTWSNPKQTNPVPWITIKDIPLYVAKLTSGGDIDLSGHPLLGYIRNNAAQQSAFNLQAGNCGLLRKRDLPNSPWVQVAANDATANGLDPAFFVDQIDHESSFNPGAVSNKGAEGIAQFMPSTAPGWGVTNPFDPRQSLEGGAKYMSSLYHHFLSKSASSREACAMALAGYDCGQGCVDNRIASCGQNWYSCLPDEAKGYIPDVMGAPSSNGWIS